MRTIVYVPLTIVLLLTFTSFIQAPSTGLSKDLSPSTFGLFATGCVGALAPELVRLYNLRSDTSLGSFSIFYIVISGAMAAMGGFVAYILPATSLWGAFYVGIATPTLISTILKQGGQDEGTAKPDAENLRLRARVQTLETEVNRGRQRLQELELQRVREQADTFYNEGQQLLEAGDKVKAVDLFRMIQKACPGYRDVEMLIDNLSAEIGEEVQFQNGDEKAEAADRGYAAGAPAAQAREPRRQLFRNYLRAL